jgi:uncharacterized protein YndB with AHSA1/START domain
MAAALRLHLQGASDGRRVGGTHRMSFHNFSTGNGQSFGDEYLQLVPNELLRYADQFDDPNLPGVLQVTVSLKPVLCGTEISIVQDGIPEPIPLQMCYLGWQESLAQLAALVEPQHPGVSAATESIFSRSCRAGTSPTGQR